MRSSTAVAWRSPRSVAHLQITEFEVDLGGVLSADETS